MKKVFVLLLLLAGFFSCIKKIEKDCVEVHVYFDRGVWAESVIYIENLLSQEGISSKRLNAQRIKENAFSSCARLLIVPGGNPETYRVSLGAEGMNNLMAFVHNGGSYLGICAGAELVAQTIVWEGVEYSGLRGFFRGKAIGPIPEIAPWPEKAITTLVINSSHPVSQFLPQYVDILYWGGSYFEGGKFELVAFYKINGKPAIISGTYGAGRWVLSGPHPEARPFSHAVFLELVKWLLR